MFQEGWKSQIIITRLRILRAMNINNQTVIQTCTYKQGQFTANLYRAIGNYIISASLSINTASVSAHVTELPPSPCVGLCVPVCLSVRKVYCGKTADWIRIPFGMVSGVGRGMCIR